MRTCSHTMPIAWHSQVPQRCRGRSPCKATFCLACARFQVLRITTCPDITCDENKLYFISHQTSLTIWVLVLIWVFIRLKHQNSWSIYSNTWKYCILADTCIVATAWLTCKPKSRIAILNLLAGQGLFISMLYHAFFLNKKKTQLRVSRALVPWNLQVTPSFHSRLRSYRVLSAFCQKS